MDNSLAPESINALQKLFGSGFNLRQYLSQDENTDEEDKLSKNTKMQQFLRNMQENQIRAYISGSGGIDSGLLSGGGRATIDIPMGNATLSPYFGGGGAYGSVSTPDGRAKVRSFAPQYGVNMNYRF